jgi:AcrR family transcriptional regulator
MTTPPPSLAGAALLAHPLAPAVMAVLAERGYREASVELFIARADAERGDFYAHFRDKEDIVNRVLIAYIADFEQRLGAAYGGALSWPDNLRAAAYEVVRWTRDYPDATSFFFLGAFEAREMVRVRRERLFRRCGELIDAGRAAAPDPEAVPPGAPLIAVGAIADTLTRQLRGTLEGGLIDGVPQMMYAAVRPYLGEAAAQAELAIAPPPDLIEAER